MLSRNLRTRLSIWAWFSPASSKVLAALGWKALPSIGILNIE